MRKLSEMSKEERMIYLASADQIIVEHGTFMVNDKWVTGYVAKAKGCTLSINPKDKKYIFDTATEAEAFGNECMAKIRQIAAGE